MLKLIKENKEAIKKEKNRSKFPVKKQTIVYKN